MDAHDQARFGLHEPDDVMGTDTCVLCLKRRVGYYLHRDADCFVCLVCGEEPPPSCPYCGSGYQEGPDHSEGCPHYSYENPF